MKIRTLGHLQDGLDKCLSWRIKELSYLKSRVKNATSLAQISYLRAAIPLLYAHWEGFIKEASELYLAFVAGQKLPYNELASCFVVFGAKKYLADILSKKQSKVNIEAVEFFRSSAKSPSNLSMSGAIRTESNLSSTVFENIALSLGVMYAPYEPYANLIDKSLLERRNKIAHGEYLDIDEVGYSALADEVLKLIRMYKTDLENLASTQAYRTPQVAALA